MGEHNPVLFMAGGSYTHSRLANFPYEARLQHPARKLGQAPGPGLPPRLPEGCRGRRGQIALTLRRSP